LGLSPQNVLKPEWEDLNIQFSPDTLGIVLAKPKVYVTRAISEEGLRCIAEVFDVEVWEDYGQPPQRVLIEKIQHVDALVSMLSDTIDKEVLNAAPKLKIIAQLAVGFDNIDIGEATRRGIYVTNTPDVLTETTADFAWALLMAASRRVVEADRYVRTGHWKVAWHPKMLTGRDVNGAILGIIGAGRIGQAIARRAQGFGMKIIYNSHSRKPEVEKLGAKWLILEELLRRSDFVTLHVPLTPETRHLIDSENLKLMKKTAYLINNSRGAVIDEKALYNALKTGQIAGAALDVFEQEPIPASSPLLALENVVLAPHISSASIQTRDRMSKMVAENLLAFFGGKKPANLVNIDVL
jgi:glyoxylate reductase